MFSVICYLNCVTYNVNYYRLRYYENCTFILPLAPMLSELHVTLYLLFTIPVNSLHLSRYSAIAISSWLFTLDVLRCYFMPSQP